MAIRAVERAPVHALLSSPSGFHYCPGRQTQQSLAKRKLLSFVKKRHLLTAKPVPGHSHFYASLGIFSTCNFCTASTPKPILIGDRNGDLVPEIANPREDNGIELKLFRGNLGLSLLSMIFPALLLINLHCY